MKINLQKVHPRYLVLRWMICFFAMLMISLATTYIEVSGMISCLIFAFVYIGLYSFAMMLYQIIAINMLEKLTMNIVSIIVFTMGSIVIDYIVFVFSLFLLTNKGIIYCRNSIIVFLICFVLQAIGTQLFKRGEKSAWQKNQSY